MLDPCLSNDKSVNLHASRWHLHIIGLREIGVWVINIFLELPPPPTRGGMCPQGGGYGKFQKKHTVVEANWSLLTVVSTLLPLLEIILRVVVVLVVCWS